MKSIHTLLLFLFGISPLLKADDFTDDDHKAATQLRKHYYDAVTTAEQNDIDQYWEIFIGDDETKNNIPSPAENLETILARYSDPQGAYQVSLGKKHVMLQKACSMVVKHVTNGQHTEPYTQGIKMLGKISRQEFPSIESIYTHIKALNRLLPLTTLLDRLT